MDQQQDAVVPRDYWEQRYADGARVWSGAPNRVLVDVAGAFAPGRALDLGCGEGADAIWLAEQGWQATGVDISSTAIARAEAAARSAGVAAHRIRFVSADLEEWLDAAGDRFAADHSVDRVRAERADVDGTADSAVGEHVDLAAGIRYDLVTASFLHSPVALPRQAVLRHAADLVAPGGRLLIVSHLAFPSAVRTDAGTSDVAADARLGAAPSHAHADAPLLDPAEEIAALDLPSGDWITELAEVRTRGVTRADGSHAALDDAVVLLRRADTEAGGRRGTAEDATP